MPLIQNFAANLCIPWCGSGVSVRSGLPTWGGLVSQIISAADDKLSQDQKDELHGLFERGEFEDILEFCRGSLGESEYRDFLSGALDIGRPGRLHEAVVQLPVPAILTTNYDRLLEAAYVEKRGALPKALTAQDTNTLWKHLARRDPFILKVHGDIVRPDTVVLTSRDYTQHVFGNHPFMTFLQRLVLGHSVLFIGTSLADIYVRRILEETTHITQGVGLPHYAILPNPGPVRSKLLQDKFNVRVIPYRPVDGEHEGPVLAILNELQEQAAAVRARRL
jgi:hypothetical protein